MSASPEIEAIVSKLSKAQREAFLRSDPAKMHPEHDGRISTYGDVVVAGQLHGLGLIKRATTFSYATPLGLAVRQHLLKENSNA